MKKFSLQTLNQGQDLHQIRESLLKDKLRLNECMQKLFVPGTNVDRIYTTILAALGATAPNENEMFIVGERAPLFKKLIVEALDRFCTETNEDEFFNHQTLHRFMTPVVLVNIDKFYESELGKQRCFHPRPYYKQAIYICEDFVGECATGSLDYWVSENIYTTAPSTTPRTEQTFSWEIDECIPILSSRMLNDFVQV